jgi:atypical dual specificity phosphatase
MSTAPASAFELHDVCFETPERIVLRIGELRLAEGVTTVFLGPAATGKSTLLRALAGAPLGEDLRMSGSLLYGAQTNVQNPDASDSSRLFIGQHVPQHAFVDALRSRFFDREVLLLDEPDRYVDESSRADLAASIRARRGKQTTVVVTHDLALAREIADDVHLLCAGALVASAKNPDFFDDPPTELAARFVRHGNCWPAPSPPPLPSHFRWVRPGELAGMGRPGLLREVDDDLTAIALAGITCVVSLTEEPGPVDALRSFGLEARHFPIQDMGVPPVGRTLSLCQEIDRKIRSGERVAVHCAAGLGRTGTILASLLVFRERKSAAAAIAEVRQVEPRFLQNRAQELFVETVAEALGL